MKRAKVRGLRVRVRRRWDMGFTIVLLRLELWSDQFGAVSWLSIRGRGAMGCCLGLLYDITELPTVLFLGKK